MKQWTAAELNRFYRYALSLTRDRDNAYDLLQAALLRWLESPAAEVLKPDHYVMRIMRNLHFDRVRRDGRLIWSPLEEAEPVDLDLAPLEQTLVDGDEAARLLAQLGDAERELLFLWAVEGYTIDEISAHMKTPRGTLLSRLHRIRRRLAPSRVDTSRESGS